MLKILLHSCMTFSLVFCQVFICPASAIGGEKYGNTDNINYKMKMVISLPNGAQPKQPSSFVERVFDLIIPNADAETGGGFLSGPWPWIIGLALVGTAAIAYKNHSKKSKDSSSSSSSSSVPTIAGYNSYLVNDYKGEIISVSRIIQRQFKFTGKGSDYGKSLLFVINDGTRLYVPDSSRMILGANALKYVPGIRYNNDPGEPYMAILAARGSKATQVIMYYNK